MRFLGSLALTVCLSAASFLWNPAALANQSAQPSNAELEAVKAKLNGRTMMDLMEIVAKKDASYSGPAYLHPQNKFMLRKSYLPYYFDAIDHFHKTAAVTANFIVGKGDQTETLTPMNIGNGILFSSTKESVDAPMNEEFWGDLTPRQLFEAFDVPKIHYTDVKIHDPKIRGKQLEIDTSLSPHYLVISAKDEMGIWVYSLEMRLDEETPMMSFKTSNQFESYRIDGMRAEDIVSIQVNNKTIYTKPRAAIPSLALREELGFVGPTPQHK